MARTKIPLALRLDPEIKDILTRRAKEERRTVTSYIEWLIAEDAARHDAKAIGSSNG